MGFYFDKFECYQSWDLARVLEGDSKHTRASKGD